MFWAADRDCKQIDIWSSALAVQVGCVDRAQAHRIADYLVRHYNEVVRHGHVRHLPGRQTWRRLLVRTIRPGACQNGAFGATPVAWVAPTIAHRDRDLAVRAVRDAISSFRRYGIYECINGYCRKLRDCVVASVTNAYGLVRPPPPARHR